MHCIITLPEGDEDFSNRVKAVKIRFVRAIPATERRSRTRIARGERAIWQRRFWEHAIPRDVDYASHMGYVHYNPVKHGRVTFVRDWPYSTFHRLVKVGFYPADWGAADVEEVAAGEA